MKESHSPCVVTFGGFIWIDVWLASRESRKRISLSIILVQPLFFLKSDRETGFSVNKKDVVLLFDRIFLSNILVDVAVIDRLVLNRLCLCLFLCANLL